jgi:hypothetical protein
MTGRRRCRSPCIADELDALGDQLDTNVPVHFHSAADIEAQIKHHAKLAMVAKQQQHQDHNAEEAKKLARSCASPAMVPHRSCRSLLRTWPACARAC